MTARPFPAPSPGDVVWCRFPEDLRNPAPGPKARPGIVVRLFAPASQDAPYVVEVCYGTKQLRGIYDHELLIARSEHPDEFALAGLSYDTKFDLSKFARLPYTDEWFEIPKLQRYGATPKMGLLHASAVPRLQAAARAGRRE